MPSIFCLILGDYYLARREKSWALDPKVKNATVDENSHFLNKSGHAD
jgi:hypothetical protein